MIDFAPGLADANFAIAIGLLVIVLSNRSSKLRCLVLYCIVLYRTMQKPKKRHNVRIYMTPHIAISAMGSSSVRWLNALKWSWLESIGWKLEAATHTMTI